MIFKSNNQLFGYGFYLWIYFLCNINLLHGGITISAQVAGEPVIDGYINSDNTLTISGTFVNTEGGAQDLDTYRNGNYEIKIAWAESGADPDVSSASTMVGVGSGSISASGTFSQAISPTNLYNQGRSNTQGDRFEINVKYINGGNNGNVNITNWGDADAGNDWITFDGGANDDAPRITRATGSFASNSYFKSGITISWQPTEALNTSNSYKSYIKFTGDDDSPADAGVSHYYRLAGTALGTGSDVTLSNMTFTTSNFSTSSSLANGAKYDVIAHLYDVAGNYNTVAVENNTTYDTTLPTIWKITSTLGQSSVTKKKDQGVNVRVHFSEYVTADGAVTVTLETQDDSGTDGTAVISSWGTAANIKDGTYTVGADDASGDLTANTVAAGATISDRAGNNMASFSIPADSNLADYASIIVDGVMPYLTKMTADPNSGALSLDETTTITAEFNEVVTLTGTIDFVLSSNVATTLQIQTVADGLDAGNNPVSQGSVVYTVIAGDLEAADLSISSIGFSAGGKITDDAGNEVTSISQPGDQELRDNAALTVETVAPVIGSITTTYATGVYGEGAEIPVTLNFLNGAAGSAEDVALTGTGTINIAVGGAVNGGTATFSAATDATVTGTYTVGASDTEGNISVESTALVGAGTLTDVAGNTAVLTMPASIFTGKTITIDRTKPFLNTITTNDYATTDTPTLKIGDQLDILLNFDNTVKLNAGNIIVTFNTTNTAGTATVSPASGDQTLTATYTVSEGESTARLDISSVALDPADADVTLTDNPTYAANNATFKPNNIDEAAGFTPVTAFTTGGWNIAVDGVYPFISNMTSDTDDGTYGIGSVISVTVNFNEAVTSNNTLELPFGLTSNISFAAISSAATSVTGTYTVVENDDVAALDVTGAAVNNGTIIDAASNELQTAGLTLPASSNLTDVPKAIVIDGVRPAAPSISSATPAGGSASLTNASDYNSYYNTTNTGMNITVDFDNANDASMENGKIRIEGRVGTSNGWQILKANYEVQSGDWGNASREAIISIVSDTVESLTDYAHGGTIYFRAYNIDVASNISSSASSVTSGTTIDLQAPSLVSITSSTDDGDYKETEDIVIIANFNDGDNDTDADDQVSLVENATLDLTMNVGSGAQSITSISSSATGTVTYTVGSGADHYSPSKVALVSVALSSADKLRDNAGNIVGTPGETAISTVGVTNMDAVGAHSIYADGLSPDAPTITSVTTDVVPVANYWNEENANAVFLTTLANDASMVDGKVYVFARTGSNNYAQVGDAHDPVTADESSGTSNISITLTAVQLATITGWPTASGAVGDVDFKIRSEDKAGNTTDTEDANKVTIHVDELDPSAGTISGLETDVTTATHSIAVQGYWNISTDYLKVSLGDISAKDDNIVGGNVLLYGNINNFGWDTLGTAANITEGNKSDFFTEVSEFGDWGGVQVDGAAPYGVKELEMNGNAWADMDQYDISIKAAVTDAAGNITEYLHTNTFATTGNSTIFIDGINSTDRPTVSSATADKADGWWGPSSDGLPIQIQLETSVDITVDVTAGTPSISLQTGDVTGSATYSGASGTTLSFAYTPTTGETSQGNSTNGTVDGRLEFKLDNNGEAVIALNNGIMHEASGNLLAAATLSTNAILPAPDTQNSLDGNKNIIIDGVAPYRVQQTLVDMTIQSIGADDSDASWTERTGYYNENTEQMLFYIYYRNTGDDANLDDFNSRVDMSLQTNDPSLDCNTATGTDCGTIQLKAEAVPSGDPITYLDLGNAVPITYSTLTNGENYLYEQIAIDATDFEGYNAVKHNAQFSDGLSMTFKAVITDLAGNQLETAVYGTPIIVDQTAPAQGTAGAVVTNADNAANIVSGYWNSHNTGIQITAPLPDDATLDGGAVHILGKVTGAASSNYLGIYNASSGNYDASYNITSDELTAQTTTVPSPTTFLADSVDGGYSGIEEISNYAEDVELTFTARVFDVAGNYTDWLPSATTITVDETVPTVTEVTSLNPNRAYKADDVVTVSVVASENITSVGTGSDNSTLEIAVGGGNGGANPTVNFRNASNDTIYYAHTVSAGESSEDASSPITSDDNLNYAATNSLVINANGGALIDPAGNNLNTLLPTTQGDSALAQKKSIIIDSDDFGVTFNYFETTTAVTDSSDSLVSVNDVTLIIRGTFTDSVQIDSIPTLAIDFPPAGASTGDIASAAMTRTGIWQYDYNLALIDSVDGNLIITPTAYDKAANIINQSSVVAKGIIRMDNLEPEFTLLSPDSNSFVNNRQVSYQLSEDVHTGKITWTRVSGNPDPNSPHEVELVSAELLDDAAYENITLTNDPVNLVDGTYYNIAWSAVDSADNPSVVDKFVSSPVLYDTTGPNVQLTYSQYVAGAGYTDTITATFNEKIWPAPQISVDYQGQFNDVSPAVNMTIDAVSGGDSTVWLYEALLPGGEENNGTTFVSIEAMDLAGNLLLATNTFDGDTLIVDNSAPACTLTYVNLTQPWLINEGKYEDQIQVIARMSEKFAPFPFPQLNLQYSDSTNDSFANLEGGISSSGDSIFTWTITLPDSIKNTGSISITLNAKDRAQNLVDRYFGNSNFTVDNTFPNNFSTGEAAPYSINPKAGWVSGITDSVAVLVPIPAISSDPTLFYNTKGGIYMELWNKTRGVGWVDIPNAQEPFADSVQLGGQNLNFFRTMAEIEAIMIPEADIVQGDSIYIRAAISDRAGNKTYGDTSSTIFVYDPYPPTVSNINGGTVLTLDTLVSQDNLTAAWTGSSDSTYNSIPGSGILNYDYKIHMHDSLGVYMDTLIDWTSTGLLEEMNRNDLGLRHNRMYSVNIRAVDVAGNVSASVISDTLYRLSSAPIIAPFDSTIIWEDSLYIDSVLLTDLDLSTVLGDKFTYTISWENSLSPTVGTIEVVDTTGVISWTPVAIDTGKFRLKVLVRDMWGLKDSIVYPITIKPVNDRPVFSQLLPDTFFVEDQTDSFKINLTHYISDEDNNDTTDITWSAVIKDTTNRPGYPRSSLFFGPGTPEFVKDYLRQKYLPKQRVTVSKTDFQGEQKIILSTMNNKSLANKINIQFFQDNALQTFAYFRTDSNYYGADHSIKFIATDKQLFNNQVLHTGLTGEDSLLLTINATNDRPQWSTIPIQSMYENDTMRFDPGAYVIDVDDTLLTFNLSVTTNSDKMNVTPAEYTSHNLGDSITFIPEKLWSDFAQIQAIAKDAFNARDTISFTIDVIRVPRPHIAINVVQNSIFTNYYDILITDTISKARNLALEVQNEPVSLDTIGRHTFRGHHKFISPGTYSIEVYADALVGDTTVFRSVGLALARSLGRWSGASSDGRFHVDGEAGTVSTDQSIMLVDSTMFKKGFAGGYKLGDEVQEFNDPVKVSLMSYQEDQAVYQRNSDDTWIELPSYYDQGRIVAYTDKMGYFRLGRKTLVVPGLTSLGQNYPNPFNPVTKITYDVGFVDGPQQHVTLSIYNLLGQHVQTLVDTEQTIGRHAVQWYGRDKAGMNVASGVYFMHMTTSVGRVQTKKVMLLR